MSGIGLSNVALGSWAFPDLSNGPVEVPYCDNITVVGYSAEDVKRDRDKVLLAFQNVGFEMHENSGVAESTVVLGAEVGGRPVRVRRDPKRAGIVRGAFQWLASGPVVTGRQIEALLGHYIP